jgi:hypothetical protein
MMDRHMAFSVPVRVVTGQRLAMKALVFKPCMSTLFQRMLEEFL